MIRLFKIVGWFEGVSLLLLLFVAMPLKYQWGMPEYVSWVGRAHGFLFIAYVGLATVLAAIHDWKVTKLFLSYVLSSVPFGTFYFEKKHLD